MPTVYLETSFISACVSRRQDAASIYRRDTSLEWWRSYAREHDLFVSTGVIADLSAPAFQESEEALKLVRDIAVLSVGAQAAGLASLLVDELVMPAPVAGDAVHVAVCCVHKVEYMVSWNVRHLANANKVRHLEVICRRSGVFPPRLCLTDHPGPVSGGTAG
jgi:hypothetical protein